MKNIMFISNGDKSKRQDANHIKMESFYAPCVNALSETECNIYAGINADIEGVKTQDGIHYYNQNVYRSIFALRDNWKAYKNINAIIKKYNIDVIHCNSPIGGFLGRVCGRKNKVKIIIYTVHGFHFFKGNNTIMNFIFRSIERHLARYTDHIITMNQEDFESAKRFKLKAGGKVHFIHGIGINTGEYQKCIVDKEKKRNELGLNIDDVVLITTGDLIKRKNHSMVLDAIAKCDNKKIKFLLCGNGPELNNLKKRAKSLSIEKQVLFLGFRDDVKELLKASDIFVFTSLQEGLPRSLMEAMASGLPCIVFDARGSRDLIMNGEGGYLCDSMNDFVNAINRIIFEEKPVGDYGKNNIQSVKEYDIKCVSKEMGKIYNEIGL